VEIFSFNTFIFSSAINIIAGKRQNLSNEKERESLSSVVKKRRKKMRKKKHKKMLKKTRWKRKH
jgi:hypothetical protein